MLVSPFITVIEVLSLQGLADIVRFLRFSPFPSPAGILCDLRIDRLYGQLIHPFQNSGTIADVNRRGIKFVENTGDIFFYFRDWLSVLALRGGRRGRLKLEEPAKRVSIVDSARSRILFTAPSQPGARGRAANRFRVCGL